VNATEPCAPPAPSATPRWCGDVVCRRVRGASVLTRVYARSPLKLLTPCPTGHAASVVMSSFGGGLVAGDEVPVRLAVEAGAACVLSTQSAGKAYRSGGRVCRQSLEARVHDDALLACLPDPWCCYADAHFEQHQRFDVAPTGGLLALDWLTSGRWGRGERWAFASLRSVTDVSVAGRPVLREALGMDATRLDPSARFRTGGFNCYAVLLAVGPALAPLAEAARDFVRDHRSADVLLSVAELRHGAGVVVRGLGPGVDDMRPALARLVAPLHDLLGADPWARRF
jgi:urease accessory protein